MIKKSGDTDLRIAQISPNPNQPRKTFDEEKLRQLADSIREHGIIQPLVVCPNGAPGTYFLIAGERRWRAAQMIGLETVPVVIRDYPGDDAMEELAIIENIHREDLNPIEEALSYQRMVDRAGTIHAAAHRLGVRPAKLHQRLPWLQLDPEIQDLVASGRLHSDVRVANALMLIEEPQHRIKMAERMAHDGVSIKTVVTACKKLATAAGTGVPAADTEREPMLARARRRAGADRLDSDTLQLQQLRQSARQMCEQCNVKTETLQNQVGEPAWTLIVHAANDTCGHCAVREVAGACEGCPGVKMLSQIIQVSRIKQELKNVHDRAAGSRHAHRLDRHSGTDRKRHAGSTSHKARQVERRPSRC